MCGKIILGIALFLIGLWLLIPGLNLGNYSSGAWLGDFISLLKGSIPAIFVFIGFVLLWIEREEMKMSKPSRKKQD